MSEVHARVLHRARETLGGHDELAAALEVNPEDLHRWIQGNEAPPSEVFLKALDIVASGRR